ncbi:ATP-NAD kinase [Trichocladium antarcticum]|uniref:ATP-NAD kinase n=1 Tax=Trichocladium antarcticum TaxID=1450529 RepID=A0AAN6URJ2_9PEZI|nr:ATP-NAD kinase [Trichocladium antarcticum]
MAYNGTNSPKRVAFEDVGSSASDDDHNPVEVVFDESNPYRRKSSLAATDSIPPHLRRPSVPHHKTECLVHQFLANQRRLQQSENGSHPESHRIHYNVAGTAPYRPDDIEEETSLDRPLDRKGSHAGDHDHDHLGDPGHASHDNDNDNDNEFSTTVPSEHDGDGNDNGAYAGASTSASDCGGGGGGQSDEKQWQAEMAPTLSSPRPRPHTPPALLDRRCSAPGPDAPNSRLLTKKQLSEMAWGVRELSRRLGSMRLKFRVKSIFLLTKLCDVELIAHTRELCRWLLDREREVRYTVYVGRELRGDRRFDVAGLVEEVRRDFVASGEASEEASWDVARRLRYWDEDMCRARPHTFDFVITLGGDGTVLYASWLFQHIVPPVLSFALGSLGFLTKFDFGEFRKTLAVALNEGVTVSLRLRFEATVMRSQKTGSRLLADGQHAEDELNGDCEQGPLRDLVEELIGEEKDDEHTHRPDGTYEVLNEVVVDRGPNPIMSTIEIFGDDEHFTSVAADGICVSTPTGSTAYNLAAGGSLCHPENPVMLMTAICAHTLSFRPVILPDTIVLRIGVPYDARTSSWASFDGRERVELRPGDYVTVSASRYPFACVQPHGRRSEDWINSIRAKLGWNTRQRQKAFSNSKGVCGMKGGERAGERAGEKKDGRAGETGV